MEYFVNFFTAIGMLVAAGVVLVAAGILIASLWHSFTDPEQVAVRYAKRRLKDSVKFKHEATWLLLVRILRTPTLPTDHLRTVGKGGLALVQLEIRDHHGLVWPVTQEPLASLRCAFSYPDVAACEELRSCFLWRKTLRRVFSNTTIVEARDAIDKLRTEAVGCREDAEVIGWAIEHDLIAYE